MSASQPRIPYGKHAVDEVDVEAVVDVLRHKNLTQGSMVSTFEQELARYCGSQYATSVNSGTSGLHVACLAAGVGRGDRVWTVPNSFVASANCALYCGASVDFVDIDPISRNICLNALQDKLQQARQDNTLPKALIVVHFAGLSCDMKTIAEMLAPYAITLIEDAAHGLGGRYQDMPIGSCQYADMAVMSFHPVKSITTAEGGAVLTNSVHFHDSLQLFSKHGVTRDPSLMQGENHGPWYYQQRVLGFNYRLSDLHAALGLSQLAKLDEFIELRRQKAARYQRELADLPVQLPSEPPGYESAWHLYALELTEHDRYQIYSALHDKGILVNVHYIPIHLQPYYADLGFAQGDFPRSETFYRRALTIPLYPTMSYDEQSRVIRALHEVLV